MKTNVEWKTWVAPLTVALATGFLTSAADTANGPGASLGFSCEETARADLVDMPNCSMNGKTLKITCVYRKGHPKSKFATKLLLLHQNVAPAPANATKLTLCLIQNLHTWTYRNVRIDMNFSHNLTVGVAVMDKSCLHHNTSDLCARHVKLRSEVATLPTMKMIPENIHFWNFTSPIFSSKFGWLYKFSMTGHVGTAKPSSAIYALQETSVSTLVLRGDKKTPEPPYKLPPLINMSELDYLEISYNFDSSNEDFFRGTPYLRYLTLRGNQLRNIPSNIRLLKHLNVLSLVNNKIQNFTKELSYHVGLKELVLDRNKLSNLDEFPNIPNLWLLSIMQCSIKSLRPHVFRNLPSLKAINMDGNPLLVLSPLAFASLPRLQLLSMSQCSLSTLPIEALTGLNLIRLTLKENSLWTLGNLGAVGTSVRVLDISNNKIQGWDDPRIFSCKRTATQNADDIQSNKTHQFITHSVCINGSWVKSVRLENNLIQLITESMRQSINILDEILLTNNPIDCGDCGTPELQTWLNQTQVHFTSPLTCKEPAWERGTPVSRLEFDPRPCLEPLRKLLMSVVMPVLVVTAVVTAGVATLFLYRTEIAYLRHLIRIRHNSKSAGADARQQTSDHSYDAFVCYSGKNRKWALRRLAYLLERKPACYRLCLFDRDFRLGTHIVSNIVEAIDQSRKVIVVLTEHFIESKWCQWELEMANHKLFGEDREFLVLLELEPLERRRLPRLLRFLLDTRPVVRWPHPETAPLVLKAVTQLQKALGPSLVQRKHLRNSSGLEYGTFNSPDGDYSDNDEPGRNTSSVHKETPLLEEAVPVARF